MKLRTGEARSNGVATKIADEVRTLVAGGMLSPGVRLGQIELAERFDSSPVPVREALKLLTSEGIVEHDPNRGFFVARLSSAEAWQLFRMRHLLEDDLLQSIEWPSRAQLADLRKRAVELERLLDAEQRRDWWLRHREFHQTIFDFSPHKVMVREAMRLWTLTDRFRAILPLPRRSNAQRNLVRKHDLVEALAEQDREKLVRLRRDRRVSFEGMVLEILEDRNL
ncbi:GntR family transcriptional regulator [Sphingomonas canadensis]|uniref:GntR family transcriptional regulator n=1 Tax=Sphingomonas canadensis TaxID=1219257 RepID=A0ABW3H7A7_9SPHN|nr:GntR family transcriptional regulator [Sphingomonas canadensis]MCW3836974.1 GntR family transcriptional regulator [Sphingomonas canadensis]